MPDSSRTSRGGPVDFSGYIRDFQRVIGLGTEGDEWDSQGTESAGNLRRDVEVSDTQIDQVGEGLQTSESTGAILDHADETIEAFGHGIGQARVAEGQDALGVFAHGAHELAQRLQAALEGGGRPALEEALGGPPSVVFPELLELRP